MVRSTSPGYALNRTSVHGLLDEIFIRAFRIIAFGLAAVVETEHCRTGGYAQAATDARVLIDFGDSVHGSLRYWSETVV
jgi:hypothetical protein